MTEQEEVEKALRAALKAPQEILCLNEKAARKVRFAIYGLRRSMAETLPQVMSLVVKVKGASVVISLPEKRIFSIREKKI